MLVILHVQHTETCWKKEERKVNTKKIKMHPSSKLVLPLLSHCGPFVWFKIFLKENQVKTYKNIERACISVDRSNSGIHASQLLCFGSHWLTYIFPQSGPVGKTKHPADGTGALGCKFRILLWCGVVCAREVDRQLIRRSKARILLHCSHSRRCFDPTVMGQLTPASGATRRHPAPFLLMKRMSVASVMSSSGLVLCRFEYY